MPVRRILGMVLLAVSTGAAAERTHITVHLYNRAGVRPAELQDAMRETKWVFRKSGVEITWMECPEVSLELGENQVCKESADPKLFVLAIINDAPPESTTDALGFAMIFGRFNHAGVFYQRIAQRTGHRAYLLAAAMTHELGHLIFRNTDHGEGIMKANLTSPDFRAMTQRQLVFTEKQSEALRTALVSRSR